MDNRTRGAKAKGLFGKLAGYVGGLGPPAVAFSGGVDSTLVAAASAEAFGAQALAVTVATEFTPQAEVERAGEVAAAVGIDHEIIRMSVLEAGGLADNPPDRCYICKKAVFGAIAARAAERGLAVLLDGTNADDAHVYRPGLRALEELGVKSPLAALGLGKAEIRRTARGIGLPNWDAPSRPCLATRFPYGERLDRARIERAGKAEEFMASLGFTEFRVRDHGGVARIELPPSGMKKAVSGGTAKKIVAKLILLGYNYVTLDLAGFRSGSMDEGLGR